MGKLFNRDSLDTPHIDRLADMGVRFNHAYVQSPICGPSRICFYTGRYTFSHGSTLNYAPLPVSELTLGDYLQPLGIRTAVVGKTHVVPNRRELERLQINPASSVGQQLQEGGFEPYFRDDGIHPDASPDRYADYNHYLRQHGFDTHNPWHQFTHGTTDEQGEFVSGWFLENSHRAADIPEEHSETTVTTTQAMAFIDEASRAEQSWCLHLSYIKPHWPFMAPAPYAQMFGADEVQPANRAAEDLSQAPQSACPWWRTYW